eukprot:1159170-Pelagomonas_calceolata.AAC.5
MLPGMAKLTLSTWLTGASCNHWLADSANMPACCSWHYSSQPCKNGYGVLGVPSIHVSTVQTAALTSKANPALVQQEDVLAGARRFLAGINFSVHARLLCIQVDTVFTSSDFVHGNVILHEALPDYAWSTNTADPGIHKIDLDSKTAQFVSLESEGCIKASDLAISGHNRHGFLRCNGMGKTFVLEIDLENDKVLQKIDIPGTPFVSRAGLSIVIVDDQQQKFHMFKAKGPEEISYPEAIVDGIEGFSQLEFVSSDDASKVHVAVASSSTQYKVLLVDMNNYNHTNTVEFHSSHNTTALDEIHGGQRSLAATYLQSYSSYDSDHIAVVVSAQELNSTFMVDIEVGSDDVPWSSIEVGQVQGIQGDSMKFVYVGVPDQSITTISRDIASTDALEKLELKLTELQRSLWGPDLSDSFWVFADDGLHVIKPEEGTVQKYINGTTLCGGPCYWGYPETDGGSYVVIPKLMESLEMHVAACALASSLGCCMEK